MAVLAEVFTQPNPTQILNFSEIYLADSIEAHEVIDCLDVKKLSQPASRDLRSIVRTRILGTLPSFKALLFDQIPSWHQIHDQE